MSWKAGDVAYITARARQVNGQYVTLLHLVPPDTMFKMPDGRLHDPVDAERARWWLCELAAPVPAPHSGGKPYMTMFVPLPERHMHPVREGDDAEDEMAPPPPTDIGGAP
jgi:hypothetical protein